MSSMSRVRALSAAAFSAAIGAMIILPDTAWATGPLDGVWAGDQGRLTIDASGGRFEAACASGTIAAPVAVAADGRFTALGSFERQFAGTAPQRVDESGKPTARAEAARFVGEVDHGHMKLSIFAEGSIEPQVFHLERGAKVKLIRCL